MISVRITAAMAPHWCHVSAGCKPCAFHACLLLFFSYHGCWLNVHSKAFLCTSVCSQCRACRCKFYLTSVCFSLMGFNIPFFSFPEDDRPQYGILKHRFALTVNRLPVRRFAKLPISGCGKVCFRAWFGLFGRVLWPISEHETDRFARRLNSVCKLALYK